MTLLALARRSLAHHALSTLVTALACALAGGLLMAVFVIRAQAYQAFTRGAPGYQAVVGAPGSPFQLVLNAVFQLETSAGNLPWSVVQELERSPGVRKAVPMAMGDSYRGFRVVGTDPAYLTDFALDGVCFQSGREAVVGSEVGLPLGASFHPAHGLLEGEEHRDEYRVVGTLRPTNTPVDRVVWIPLEGVWRMEGHVLRGAGREFQAREGQPIPEADREVSAVLLQLDSPQTGFALRQQLDRRATVAFPIARVVAEVFEKVGWAHKVLTVVAYLVCLVSGAAVLASLYNTLEARRQEFAVLRALGMRRRSLLGLLVLEAGLIGALGAVASYAVYAAILGGAAVVIRAQTGVSLALLAWHPVLLLGPLGTVSLAALAGLPAGARAYATPVGESVQP